MATEVAEGYRQGRVHERHSTPYGAESKIQPCKGPGPGGLSGLKTSGSWAEGSNPARVRKPA